MGRLVEGVQVETQHLLKTDHSEERLHLGAHVYLRAQIIDYNSLWTLDHIVSVKRFLCNAQNTSLLWDGSRSRRSYVDIRAPAKERNTQYMQRHPC